MLFSIVEVLDHELEEWAIWAPLDAGVALGADDLLQRAIDAGHDDIRLVLHVSGSREESVA